MLRGEFSIREKRREGGVGPGDHPGLSLEQQAPAGSPALAEPWFRLLALGRVGMGHLSWRRGQKPQLPRAVGCLSSEAARLQLPWAGRTKGSWGRGGGLPKVSPSPGRLQLYLPFVHGGRGAMSLCVWSPLSPVLQTYPVPTSEKVAAWGEMGLLA